MRITVITNLFPNPAEPQRSTFNENQLIKLAEHVSIDLISPVSWIDYLGFDKTSRQSIRTAKSWRDKISVSYPLYYYLPRLFRTLAGFSFFLSILPAWFRAHRNRPELILSSWAYPDGFASILLGILYNLPVIIKVHGSDVEFLKKKCLSNRITIWALRRSRKIISVSHYLKRQLVELGIEKEKIEVIYNGVDISLFCPASHPAAGRYFVYVGNLKRSKGVNDLVEAVDKQFFVKYQSRLLLVGDGPERKSLESKISEKHLEEHVILTGRLPHARLSGLLRDSLFICLPSHHEGIPNVLIEAIQSGVPVLATNVGGIPEIVTSENGLLVEPFSSGELYKGLVKMHEINWNKDQIIASSRMGSWQDSALKIYRLVQEVTR